MKLTIEVDLTFFRVLLGMIEIWKACHPSFNCLRYVLDKFLRVESELCATARVGVFWVLHLVELVSVVVVAIHRHDQGLDAMLLLQYLLHVLAEVALAGGATASHSDERYTVAARYQ